LKISMNIVATSIDEFDILKRFIDFISNEEEKKDSG